MISTHRQHSQDAYLSMTPTASSVWPLDNTHTTLVTNRKDCLEFLLQNWHVLAAASIAAGSKNDDVIGIDARQILKQARKPTCLGSSPVTIRPGTLRPHSLTSRQEPFWHFIRCRFSSRGPMCETGITPLLHQEFLGRIMFVSASRETGQRSLYARPRSTARTCTAPD